MSSPAPEFYCRKAFLLQRTFITNALKLHNNCYKLIMSQYSMTSMQVYSTSQMNIGHVNTFNFGNCPCAFIDFYLWFLIISLYIY